MIPGNGGVTPMLNSKSILEDSKATLLKETLNGMKVHPMSDASKVSPGGSFKPPNHLGQNPNLTSESSEMDEDRLFLDMVDLIDVEKSFMDNAIEKIEETTFDAFNFC